MRRMRSAASMVAAIVLSACAVAGCSDVVESIAESIVRGSDVNQPSDPAPIVEVDPPDASLASLPVVAEAARSVVKIHTVVPACQKILEGSGVVIAPNRVMTNAHVVAGGNSVSISVDGQDHSANVVSYNPDEDISILDVPGLQAPQLTFAEGVAPTGSDALIMGYPGGSSFAATPARIREVIELDGPDIYRTTSVTREVYAIRGSVRQGDSGGPLIDLNGRVLGIAFGAAVDDPDTSFVLTAKQVSPLAGSVDGSQPVATGDCIR